MPERKHNLPTQFNQLDDEITGTVLGSIMVYPRSRGILYLRGEYSTSSRPPGHRVEVVSTDPDNASVYTEENHLGGPDHYVVNYDVWNHRDSPTFARLVLTDSEPADTAWTISMSPGGRQGHAS
jgi:hypothetical protein